jgi:hypothetical protein
MRAVLSLIGLVVAGWLVSHPVFAVSTTKEQVKGLDEQVQDIKSDVLAIGAELSRLEEKLLYPSGTQVSLFVSLAKGEKFRLDSVNVRIDGKDVADHLYTFKEVEALQKGGVQRVYTGNIPTGEHQLQVTIAGKSEGGGDYRQTSTATITKGVGPKLVEIRLAGPGSRNPGIDIKDR